MKIGIYPGSFDPVHSGHIKLAEEAVQNLGLDKLILMPAYVSPGKQKSNTGDAARLALCRAATEGNIRITVSSLEIERGGKSYTAETVDTLKQMYPNDELILIMGADKLPHFHRWHRFEDIMKAVKVAVFCRSQGDDRQTLETIAGQSIRPYGECRVLQFVPLEISSTQIREKIKKGEDITGFVPEKVKDMIVKEGLYLD